MRCEGASDVPKFFSLLLVLSVVACSGIDDIPYKGLFVNGSSYTLAIAPSGGQSWEPFTLAPGDEKRITVDEDRVLFTVSPAVVVWVFNEKESTVTFYDRDPNSDDDTLYCLDGATACDGVTAIYYCNGGFWKRRPCADACVDLGYAAAVGCGYSSNAGKDQCFCE